MQHLPLPVALQACQANDFTGAELYRVPQGRNGLAGDAGQNPSLA
jgi:hypothetical protein